MLQYIIELLISDKYVETIFPLVDSDKAQPDFEKKSALNSVYLVFLKAHHLVSCLLAASLRPKACLQY